MQKSHTCIQHSPAVEISAVIELHVFKRDDSVLQARDSNHLIN
jgi:hypothetical protein